MNCYVIATHDKVTNYDLYRTYKQLAVDSIKKYNGELFIRANSTKIIAGNWDPERIVIIKFPTVNAALEWADSPEYKEACLISDLSADGRKQIIITSTEEIK